MNPVDNRPKYFVAFAIAIIVIALGLLYLNINVRDNLSKSTCNTLEEIMQQQAYNFTSTLKSEEDIVQSIAEIIAPSGKLSDIKAETLHKLLADTSFEYLSVADLNGISLTSTGETSHMEDRPFFQRSLKGETVVSEPFQSRIVNDKVIAISTPIKNGEEIIGVLVGSYTSKRLNQLFLSSFDGKGYAYVTNNEGTIIARTTNDYSLTSNDNLFDDWKDMNFYANDKFETMRQNLYENKSGHSKYENNNGQKRLMHYTTIPVNDWNLFSVVPDDVISQRANQIVFMVYALTVLFILMFGFLLYQIIIMQKAHIKRLSDIAFVDELTGAPTLAKFKMEAQRILEENPNSKFVLVKNDIDRFKLINQVLGFAEGDKVLKNVAKAFEACSQSQKETFARANIDEFVLLHEYISDENLFQKRQVFLDAFHSLMGEEFGYKMNFPAGHYFISSEEYRDISAAVEKANMAHRKAKQTGVEICEYDESLIQSELERKDIENKMEEALKNNEFKMFLQAKRYLSDESVAGAEALARWWINGRYIMHPADFIPVFEKNGFVVKLDKFMFDEACKFISNLIAEGKPPIVISVNFSRLHLRDETFVQTLCDIADSNNTPRQYLEIEITETAILDNEDVFNDVLTKLHMAGFTLSMDDFGTGYSSLGLLKNIDFDVIKIDRSFFINAPKPEKAKYVLSNVIQMAKDLGIHTVAEGVEQREHIELLRELGCDIVQGYYYAKPVPFEEFEKDMFEKDMLHNIP